MRWHRTGCASRSAGVRDRQQVALLTLSAGACRVQLIYQMDTNLGENIDAAHPALMRGNLTCRSRCLTAGARGAHADLPGEAGNRAGRHELFAEPRAGHRRAPGEAPPAGDGLQARALPNDLLFCWRAGTLGGDIAVVVSNHETLRQMTEAACRSWFSLRTCRFSPTTSARSYRVLFHGGSTVVFR